MGKANTAVYLYICLLKIGTLGDEMLAWHGQMDKD